MQSFLARLVYKKGASSSLHSDSPSSKLKRSSLTWKMATSWTVPFTVSLVVIYILSSRTNSLVSEAKKSTSFHHPENGFDDELIPAYECSQRSRDWTLRCLIPVTNFQMAIDLCGTKQKPAENLIKQCMQQLYVLGKSCPQPSMLEAASAMMHNEKPPPPPNDLRSKQKKSASKRQEFQLPKSFGGKSGQNSEKNLFDL